MKEGERGPFFPKPFVRIKVNNSSPHGKFYRFLFPFSSKFSDLNFASYVLYNYLPTHSEPGLPVVRSGMQNGQARQRPECLFTVIVSLKRNGSVLSMKNKQSTILRLEKGEKGTNLSAEYGVSKQQISNIGRNKENIMKYADNLKSPNVAHDEQLDKANAKNIFHLF